MTEPIAPKDIYKHYKKVEGNTGNYPKKLLILKDFSNKKSVLEIGMNAGHSTEVFLQNGCEVVSFDIGSHPYIHNVKKYFDETYPSKHELIIGDSAKTIPRYIKNNPSKKFDLIFIDGGHKYINAITDIKNCRNLARKDTILLVDDIPSIPDVKKAWDQCIKDKIIVQDSIIDTISNSGRKSGIASGKYLIKFDKI